MDGCPCLRSRSRLGDWKNPQGSSEVSDPDVDTDGHAHSCGTLVFVGRDEWLVFAVPSLSRALRSGSRSGNSPSNSAKQRISALGASHIHRARPAAAAAQLLILHGESHAVLVGKTLAKQGNSRLVTQDGAT